MKRYLLFKGDHYYPAGGMEDFVNDFDTVKEAKAHLPTMYSQHCIDVFFKLYNPVFSKWMDGSWANIYDTAERKEVWTYDERNYEVLC